MARALVGTLALGCLALVAAAEPAAPVTFHGTVLASDFAITGGTVMLCDTEVPRTDGAWVDIAGLERLPFRLDVAVTLDASVFFYDAACEYLGGANAAGYGGTEAGTVPATGAYVFVAGYQVPGHGAFTLTIG